MKKSKKIGLIVLAIIGAGIAIKCSFPGADTPQDTIRATVAQTKVLELNIMSTGSIEPVNKVEVGTQVSGIVEKIYVDFNSEVKEGQILASLDKLTLNERVRQSKAALENAKSNQLFAQQNYERTKRLYEQDAATLAQLEDVENRLQTANGSVIASDADYRQTLVNLSYADIY